MCGGTIHISSVQIPLGSPDGLGLKPRDEGGGWSLASVLAASPLTPALKSWPSCLTPLQSLAQLSQKQH